MGGGHTVPRQLYAVLAVALLAFLLRAIGLGQSELGFDEALSAVVAGKGWAGIIGYTQRAPFEHPPLYYLALHGWMHVAGSSEFVLRYFSLFWGVLLIPLVYQLMASWGGHPFALLTALIAALSTTYIAHSQYARMYTLLPVLGVLLFICFFRALRTGRLGWWVGFLLVSILGIATHYYFALLLLVPITFVLLAYRRYRRHLAFLLLVLAVCVLPIAGWFWLSPGLRSTVQQVLTGQQGGSASLGQRILYTAGGVLLEQPVVGHLVLGGLALLGVILWPLPPPASQHPVRFVGARRFLLLWLLVPWLVALAIPYWLQDRHLAYLWPALYALVACGLLALRARAKALFAAGLVVVVVTCGYWQYVAHTEVKFEFGRIMAFIERQALADDQVVMNQPALWPLADYYAQRDLATAYVPEGGEPLTRRAVADAMTSLAAGRSRIWLGPIGAWTADPDSLVEQWLATHTFQATKEWFGGSGSAALYFTPPPLELLQRDPGVTWESGIRLLGVEGSAPVVAPGDALRLLFTWQATQPIGAAYLVSVHLVDSQGRSWAVRQSAPCSGWCPTDAWEAGGIYEDRHALLVEPGTPPGTYHVEVGWDDPTSGRALAASGNGPRLDLGEVQVVRSNPMTAHLLPAPTIEHPLDAAFGELLLQGYDLPTTEVTAGDRLELGLHWRARSQPTGNYRLLTELVGRDDQVVAQGEDSPAADSYPTQEWRAGEYVQGIHYQRLPEQLAPGQYRVRLTLLDENGRPLPVSGSARRSALGGLIRWSDRLEGDHVDLGTIEVSRPPERPHRLDLPEIGHPLHVRLAQQVELMGYDLGSDSAVPGGQVELTLYWRGQGPTDRPYKVFTHVTNEQLDPLAQHDSVPGAGCCPTDTWVQGEVVIDPHVLTIPADLKPGAYQLLVGMYHEASGQRLALQDDQGGELAQTYIPVAEVVVQPLPPSTVSPERPSMNERVYLPLLGVER